MSLRPTLFEGPTCSTPHGNTDRVQLGHGSGGRMSAALLRDHFLPRFTNDILSKLGDAAIITVDRREIAISTDTFVVSPLEFPGGNIGTLAVHGTVNDVAMMGAEPLYLTVGFILEEGLPFDLLDRVLDAMSSAAAEAGVTVVTGDTKVVERGSADGMFINTTGVGLVSRDFRPAPGKALPGDVVIASGPIGRHGIAVMALREGLEFEVEIESDTAALHPLVSGLRERVGGAVHVLRDPTRGGIASALNEVALASGIGVELEGGSLVIPGPVSAACEMLGLDPLYVANEGLLVAFVAPGQAEDALASLRSHPLGEQAAIIGQGVEEHPGMVVLKTGIGGRRVVDMLPGDQLPRIC